MDKNLDEIFDLIIAGESKRIISISNGVKIEKSPSYFRDMKRMYSKSWDTMYNPNNVFIPYILVSIEFILRQLVDVDITVSTKAPTAKELLDALTGKKRLLQLLKMISLLKEYRNFGIGTELMEQILLTLKERI